MRFGLVTYLWGRDWDLPTLLENCEAAGVLGVELRTTHDHGVEITLDAQQREAVKQRFEASPVTLVGLGSDERFDSPDPAQLRQAAATTREFVKLSHDVGGSGVKVKPNSFHEGVSRDATLEQIGRSLQELGPFAEEYGQEIRLEVHGQCAPLPLMRRILDVASHPAVRLCWNSNPQDLEGEGLEASFRLVRERFGDTLHVHELDSKSYPYPRLAALLKETGYDGWVLLEASSRPPDRVAALRQQARLWEQMVAGR